MPISERMVEALKVYIRLAFQDAKAFAKTTRIENNIQMEDVHFVNPNRIEASLFVSLKAAPEARAYELGSGLHGEFGQKYGIAAKNVPNLVFWWEREKKWFVGPQLPIGHPGVKASPALRPAMLNNIEYLRQTLRTSIRREVVATIRNNFRQIYKGTP